VTSSNSVERHLCGLLDRELHLGASLQWHFGVESISATSKDLQRPVYPPFTGLHFGFHTRDCSGYLYDSLNCQMLQRFQRVGKGIVFSRCCDATDWFFACSKSAALLLLPREGGGYTLAGCKSAIQNGGGVWLGGRRGGGGFWKKEIIYVFYKTLRHVCKRGWFRV